ncbi:NAD-dependent epimerase/dehydratase family protein [Haloechinothrix sp. LS1_15]|uniref:NAD-dependent epimerase/dehydratase family protein n=1 Tax=Haloechinothrix sp. LS1_15 TaxID=2652248 RepID=UPI002945481C|nr:NAD-dependent epimerase/dehydratase family protein [Haloechinothrix sp. LS1_15]MDV6012430.1 NAD-dependent epimerase/dehydratase family protein [Haloechinothrix sp. LS1_15]
MSVLLVGCGDLGTEVGLRFAAEGRHVVALRRTVGNLPVEITGYPVDLTDGVPDIPGTTEIVVIALTADQRTEAAYRSTYMDGVANALEAVRRVHPERVLFVSSTSVYGVSDGRWIDEETPAEPASPNGAVLLEAERLLHERVPRATVFRLAGLYGPGRGALLRRVREGEPVPDPPGYTNRIHRDDAAAAIVHLTTRVADPASVYLGADHSPASQAEIMSFLATELGVPQPAGTGREPVRGKRCRNDRLVTSGFRFTYPTYREGYRAVLAGHGVAHR